MALPAHSGLAPLVAALALCCCMTARGQVAPGPLSRAHQQLEGITKCGSCHEFGTGSRGFKCLECHVEIRRRVEAKLGFHARNYRGSEGETDCRRCHREHKGQATPLIRLDRQNFDHLAQTGFALVGKHRQQKCENCHVAAKVSSAARIEIKVKDLNHTFLGLRRECTACHKDQHQGQLGADCLRCHTQNGFKPATGFNHSAARFQLTGLHQTQPCGKCHGPRPGQEVAKFKGLAFDGCQSCHNDPHRGAFQEISFRGSCDTCHNTGGWKSNRPGAEFKHALAKFRLEGKHTELACAKCHKSADFKRPIAHELCRQCHEDPHKGQFAARAAGSDCASCHDVKGFKPVRFGLEQHRGSAFPLEGKHASLRCPECHQPEGRSAVYISRKLACPDCHTDRHGGQFAGEPHRNRCNECHEVSGFKPTTFSVERHSKTQFPLAGRHASVACEKCHKPLPDGAAGAALAVSRNGAPAAPPRNYRFPSRTCNSCHEDPHQTRVACETCHTPEQWKAVQPFEHSTTRFRIEGAHRNVKCVQCHKPSGSSAPAFANTPMQCVGCHTAKEPHGGQFTSGGRFEDCSTCHVMARWKGEDFQHERAAFVLNRVHRDVECAKCHKDRREVAGKMIRVYRGTPAECVKCHVD